MKIVGLSTIIYVIIGSIVIAVGGGLIVLVPKMFGKGLTSSEIMQMKKLLLFTILNVAVSLGTTGFSNTIIAFERFGYQKLVLIIQLIAKGVFVFLALKVGMGSVGIVFVQLILTFLSRFSMVLYVLTRLKIKPSIKNIDKALVKEVLGFSGWIFLMMIATQINRYLDQIILGAFVSSSAVLIAIYSTGMQIEYYFEHVGYAMNNVLMPGVVRLIEKNTSPEGLCDEMVRIGRCVFTILAFVWISFIVCGEQFITLWVGSDFKEAYKVSILLMTVSMITMTQGVGDNMLTALNKLKEWAILNVIIIIINFILSIILVNWNPIMGVLIGTFFSMLFCGVVVKNLLYVKNIHINLLCYYKNLLKNIWLCVVITLIFGLALNYAPFSNNWSGLALKVLIIGFVYSLLMWIYGLDNKEKKYLKSLLIKNNIFV